MINRNVVMQGLTICSSSTPCKGCPYNGHCDKSNALLKDALELIRDFDKQRIQLMGYSGISAGTLVYIENRDGKDIGYCECVMDKGENNSYLFYGGGNLVPLSAKDYGREWRCWTRKPSARQKAMTMWMTAAGQGR